MDSSFPRLDHVASYLRSEMAAATSAARRAESSPHDALLAALAALPPIEAVSLPRPEVDRADEHGNTPLLLAAANGDYAIALELYKAGSDITRMNRQGCSALTMVLRALRRCRDNEDRVRLSLTLEALLGVLNGMLDNGGPIADKARAILKAGLKEASDHAQAEQCSIIQVLDR
jgi:ankyrin repeat protein